MTVQRPRIERPRIRTATASAALSAIEFIQTVLYNPETEAPFELLDAEIQFLAFAFQLDEHGRLKYPELAYCAIKKSGKTAFAAMLILTLLLLYGGKFAEGYCIASSREQAVSRVFQAARRIVECSPLLKREAKITQDRIVFPHFHDATIFAISSEYSTSAGANPTISVFDELWTFDTERDYRLWDEMVPSPARQISCRLVVSYAGFSGESVLLETLYRRGIEQPTVGPSLHAGNNLLMAWHHEPIAPWQTEAWLEDMQATLRPNQYLRIIRNEFVTSESTFIDLPAWDRCVNPSLGHAPPNKALPIFVGIDASVKHDQSAVVACTYDQKSSQVRLVTHYIFQPSPHNPLDFEATIERVVLDLQKRYSLRQVLFDPYQMQSTSQRLARQGVPISEFPQSSPNLTSASQNLYELVQSQSLVVYANEAMRVAVSRAVAVESPRGWRIAKEKQSHKIDVVVALAMAAYAAVQSQSEPAYSYDRQYIGWNEANQADKAQLREPTSLLDIGQCFY